MTVFSDSLDVIYGDANFRTLAEYAPPLPPGGDSAQVVLLTRRPDADVALGAAGFRSSVDEQKIALTATVRAAEIATPRRAGTLTITDDDSPLHGRSYEIVGEPKSINDGLEWSLALRAKEYV